jgi:hypothetical protein
MQKSITSHPPLPTAESARLYSLCFFDRGWIVPQVQFVDADSDEDALILARSMKPWMTREIWDRHRLVRVLPPSC